MVEKQQQEKKTILFVIESLHCGGAEKSLVTLLNNIDYTLYEVTLRLIKKGGEFEKFVPSEVNVIHDNALEKGISLTSIVAKAQFYLSRRFFRNKKYNTAHLFWNAYSRLIPDVKKTYDIAIAYSQGFATYYVADKVTANKKFSWLNIDYSYAKHYPKFDYTKYKKYDSVVCVSETCKESLLAAMKTTGNTLPTTIIKDITDPKMVEQLGADGLGFPKNPNAITLLTVGRLAKQKGLHLAIDACKILVEKGIPIQWSVIGTGTEKTFLENRIKENNLQDSIQLLGFKENPYPYMRSCDIYVQTSLFEGLGLTVIEASMLNKPIVTTNFPTAYTIIKPNETGLIVEMNSTSIAAAILKYINTPNLMARVTTQLSVQDHSKDKALSLETFKQLL